MTSKFQETNSFVLDEFLDTFGREFCKHEVLWKPQPNCKEFGIQSATHVAYKTLAQVLNLSLEVVLELLETFPAACLDLISRYELRRRIDAGCRIPDWLTLLAGHFRHVNKYRKYNKSAVFARHELVRALCESARMGLGAGPVEGSAGGTAAKTNDMTSRLRGPQAVAYFVARHGVSEEEILPAWRSVLEMSVVKLRAVLSAGDRVGLLPSALRPSAAERALADLALLHDRKVSQVTVLSPIKLRMLVLLFQLIVAAKRKYDEGWRREGSGEVRSDESALLPEKSSEDESHPQLDPQLATLVISSHTSDGDISDKYSGECSKNNIEVPVSLAEGRVEQSGSDMMKKTNASYRDRERYISSKSDSRSEYPTKYWYEESESNSSEKRKAVWALVYKDFLKRGRSASLISLQHRWVELLHLARTTLLTAWSSDKQADKNVHPLLLAVAYWFPQIVTDKLPSWERLVSERQIVLESDIKDIIPKHQKNDKVLLNIPEYLSFRHLLTIYVLQKNLIYSHGESNSNATNKHVGYQIHKENPTSIINNTDKNFEQESQAINNELNVNNNIITMLDQIDPSQAKVSIIILEDSDEDNKDDNSTNTTETTSDLNNLNVSNSEQGATDLREENNHILNNLGKCNSLTEIAMKNNEKELKDNGNCINNPINPSDLFVTNNRIELNENINDNNELLKDKQRGSQGLGYQDKSSLLEPCESVIDDKLVHLSRIVVTPIEHLPEWKKHSRNGVIKCRNFSVRNFTKPVLATSKQIAKCTPYVKTNNNDNEKCEGEKYRKNEVRIKFEDDSLETDFDFGDDINNGIKYQKYIELYTMADHMRKNRIKLTRKLKLSRTYFSLNFWSLDSNIELLKLCKPISIKLNKGIPRVAKPVELSDITEVRWINRSILTAQVSPTIDTTVSHTQRSCASQEAVNSTNNSISLDSGTTKKTTNSLSRSVDSQELLNMLTNYAIQTKINKKSIIESVTKDITSNSNLMDSILETMRLEDKNNIQNSTLQKNPLPSSATNTFHTIQTCTEEVRNNSLLDATASKIHLSSNHTKDLYIKHLQKNINNTSFKPEKSKMPNVGDVKDMILLLVKQFDNETSEENSMKSYRNSLNWHLKKLEKQQRALVKNMSKLTTILPQYVVNIKPKKKAKKNSTAANQQKNIHRIKSKQSKEFSTLPSSHTENITDEAINTNSVFVDDDCELNLVIDERNLEQTDNVDFNNSQCNQINTNKHIQETCNVRKNDKKEKNIKKAKKKLKLPKKIPEIEKPMLNEYQEWHRQKTMALKYFTLPTSDTSKLTSKDKIAKQKSTTTSTEQQNSGCQTNLTMKRKNTEDLTTTSTEQQSNGCQTNLTMKRKNTEDIATTSTEQQSNGCQTNITIKRKNTEQLATTSTEQQSNGCQTNITIKTKNTEHLATTSTEQQSNGCQTNITIKRKNTEHLATTSTEQQNSGSQTNITIKRKNTEHLATTSTEQQNSGSQTNITIKRKNTEHLATTSTEQQNSGSQTNITIKRKNTEHLATTSTEQQNSGCQTNITIKRKNTEHLATTSTEQQNSGCQTNITIKRKNTEHLATTSTEQQNSGSQTNITIKRKNTEHLATTSTVSNTIKRSKLDSNEGNVVYISDSSSDDDVQITDYYIPKNTNENNPNTTQPDIHQIDKIENGNKIVFLNDTSEKQTASPNVCVINTPVANSIQPVYLIINDTETLSTTTGAINKTQDSETINNPIFVQVIPNGTLFPTLTPLVQQNKTQQTQMVVMNEKCQRTNKCKCNKCENTLKDDILTSTLDVIQNVTSLDSGNNEPSTSLPRHDDSLIKEAITVKEYLESNKNLIALIKVGRSKKLLFFCSKYIILTDVNIPSVNATYSATIKINNKNKLSQVLVPSESKGSVLFLGLKTESDYIHCECLKETRGKCNFCQHIDMILPNPTKMIKIGKNYYKNIGEEPNKYVRLNDKELATNSRSMLEGNPDLILVNKMFFKKLTDSPLTYVRILSAPPDAATLRHLVRKEVLLYAFDVTKTQHDLTPLKYAQTDRQFTVNHTDDKLVNVLQWILN